MIPPRKMKSPSETSPAASSSIVELRRYTLHPGQRDALINLFEREFIETQEAVGIEIIGLFRDLDDPDAFVWLRGFSSMEARRHALAAFYEGPTWKAHRGAANATMIDSDDVRLLRPAPFAAKPASAHPITWRPGMAHVPRRLVVATIDPLAAPSNDDPPDPWAQGSLPTFAAAGAHLLGRFVTEHSPNTFLRLPVREGENVAVCFWSFPDLAASRAQLIASLTPGPGGDDRAGTKTTIWRLQPTGRSRWP